MEDDKPFGMPGARDAGVRAGDAARARACPRPEAEAEGGDAPKAAKYEAGGDQKAKKSVKKAKKAPQKVAKKAKRPSRPPEVEKKAAKRSREEGGQAGEEVEEGRQEGK